MKERISEEIHRLENSASNPSEAGVIRGYIETLLGLPWDKASRDNQDLARAREILEEDHYGLSKVKEKNPRIPGRTHPDEERREPDSLPGRPSGNR